LLITFRIACRGAQRTHLLRLKVKFV